MADSNGNGNGGGLEFGGGSYLPAAANETAIAAAAAQARSQVEARFALAFARPRDFDDVRVKLLKECHRTRFAETARYAKPVGGRSIEGPSIRFAEAAVRCMGNIDVQTPAIYEDDEKRIVRVTVTDLESNATFSSDVTIAKTVERKSPKGYEVLGERTNSYGDRVYIVRATDDDLLNKHNALVSKAIRNNALRILPGDLLDEAMDTCMATLRRQDAQDPDSARKKVVDAFAGIGVKPSDLKLYLGHEVASCSPAEIQSLRQVYAAIKDGETSWAEVLIARQQQTADAKAADRTADVLDEKDVAKLKAKAAEVASKHDGVDAEAVLADVLFVEATGEIRELASIPKGDLPKVLKAVASWKPTEHPDRGADADPEQGELPA